MIAESRRVSPPREELGRLRQPLTAGEKLVFELFDTHLAPEWEIYVQPHLNGLRPDFVLLNPGVGIAVFEVKDWNLDAMIYSVVESARGRPELFAEKDGKLFSHESENPISKIALYKDEIFNLYCPRLRRRTGFAVITGGVIFPFAGDARVKALLAPCVKFRGMDKAPDYNPVSGREALERGDIDAIFPQGKRKYSHEMNSTLAKDMRSWLNEPDAPATQRQPVELDKNQRSFVTSRTESGYRRIRGPAGSGKSLILAARAAELLGQGKSVLVVTFNITLLHYLMDVAVRWPSGGKTRSGVTWLNFHLWCKRICIQSGAKDDYDHLWHEDDTNHVLAYSLPALVSGILDCDTSLPVYDAVLVDEGQDFMPNWWEVLRKVCKSGGEMLLVADVTQDIYGTANAWTDDAMIGAGFSGKWAELETSYRMPRIALDKAAEFAEHFLPEATRLLPKNDQMVLSLEPCDLRWVHVRHVERDAARVCCEEILRIFSADEASVYSFADATFLCNSRTFGHEVVGLLGQRGVKCVHTFDMNDEESRRQKVGFYMGDAKVKATTLHSFKGWESRCLVIFMSPNLSSQSLALFYTGLTRIKRHVRGSSLTVVSSSEELRPFGRKWPVFCDV